jgi:SOS response associated peptidase (SRAP)
MASYEWQAQGRRKQPWFIRMQDSRPFAFAGLWDRWRDPKGRGLESCTIITTTANALIQPFHHRMPVIISPADVFAVVQIIPEGLIVPQIMRSATGFRPVAILLGLFIWGILLGFLGLLLYWPSP